MKPASTYKCVYQDRGASGDNRILYNTDTMRLVKQGSVLYQTQTAGKNPRYFVWAVFAEKATGKQFFFTTTHLDPYLISSRKAQWSS